MAPCVVVERLEEKQRCSRAAVSGQAGIQTREWSRWLFTKKREVNEKTTKPCNSPHTITTAQRPDNIPLIYTGAGLIHPVHSQPMSLATEAMPRNEVTFLQFSRRLSISDSFSEKADLCWKDTFLYKSNGVRPSGRVVVWLWVFAIFVMAILGLLTICAVFANITFNEEKYEEEELIIFFTQQEESAKICTEPRSYNHSGYIAIDAFKVYDSYSFNIFHSCLLIMTCCWLAWVVWGVIVLWFYVPWECTCNSLRDNTMLIMMYIAIITSLIPVASLTVSRNP